MARHRVQDQSRKIVENGEVPSKLAAAAADRSAAGVTRHPLPDTSRLLTVGPQDALWSGDRVAVGDGDYSGAFVRVQPPNGADDARIEAVRMALNLAGAEAVTVAPRAKGAGVIVTPTVALPSAASSRAVVLTMAAEANTRDRPALVQLLETFLGKAGL